MARAFVRVGLCVGLSSCLGLWSLAAAAQATGDTIEDDSESGDKGDSQDQASDKEEKSKDDAGDGDWSSTGGGSTESGFHFGLRLAYGFPLGKATKTSSANSSGGKMSDIAAGQIPIWLDLGWQFTPGFMAGAYASYGFVLPSGDLSDACDAARASCTLSDIRVGLQAQLSFSPGRSVDPWLGLGVGYEWFTLNEGDSTFRLHGWELPMLQGGIDFGGDSAGSTIGPFVAFTVGQFSRVHVKTGGIDATEDVPSDDKAMHNWLFLGIRGVVK